MEVELFKWSADPGSFDGLISDEITRVQIGGEALYEPLQDRTGSQFGGFGTMTLLD